MKSIWGILTVVAVCILAGMVFLYGTRSGRLEQDVRDRFETVKNSDEVKAALKKFEELRAQMNVSLGKLSVAIQEMLKDLRKEADPEIQRLSKMLDAVTERLDRELAELNRNLDKTTASFKAKWNQLSADGRQKALAGYEKLQDEIDKLETSVAITMIGVKSAAKKGAEEFQAQKAKLEEHLKKVDELKGGLVDQNPEK